jgi:hypothetical protein
MFAASFVGASLILLSACGKSAPGGSTASAPTAAAPSAAAGPLSLDQVPRRRPGLWTQTMAMQGAPAGPPSMQICVDADSEAKMSVAAQKIPDAHCDSPSFSRNLDGTLNFSTSCDMGANGKAQTSGVIKGDFQSSYTMDMNTKYSGSPVQSLNGDHKMTISATRVGDSAPGQRGGDMILANGMKMNALDNMPGSASGARP